MTAQLSFGQWLKQRRKAHDVTQDELAERVGCAVETIRKIEGDLRRPSRDIAERIAQEMARGSDERAAVVRLARALGPANTPLPETRDSRAHNLPRPATLFIGREREVALVVDLLGQPHVRLLTLTGCGGTGKTRLAIQAARLLIDDFAQGLYWVPLAAITDPEMVPTAMARALGVQEIGGIAIIERLHEFLRDKDLLVVLDNFEQVVRAAPLLAELLQAAPELKLLVTSRIMLHLAAEHEVPVPPLALPPKGAEGELAAVTQYEAVALFIQQAQAILPAFQMTNATAPAVAEICHRLDGLPLAIELAAARSKLFAPQALLKHLSSPLKLLTGGARDAARRQQTLRATIAWSYDLLSLEEQQLFAQLAVFAGGWTLEAAEAVCITAGEQPPDVLDGLQALLDQSLMRYVQGTDGEPRFVLLETIREYALERLDASGDAAAVRARHAAYYLQLAKQAEASLWAGPDQLEWLARLEADHDNLRAVLQRALTSAKPEVALELGGTLWRFWLLHGHLLEGLHWLELALTGATTAPPVLRAKALCGLGSLAIFQPDGASRSVVYLEESVALYRIHGPVTELVTALWTLGNAYNWIADAPKPARAVWEESIALGRSSGAAHGLAYALLHLASITSFYDNDHERARELIEESVTLMRQVHDQYGLARALIWMGRILDYHGEWEASMVVEVEGLALARALHNPQLVGDALGALGGAATWRGAYAQARGFLEESLAVAREQGNQGMLFDPLYGLGYVALFEGKHAQAIAWFDECRAVCQALGDRWTEANAVNQYGWVYLDQGNLAAARRYFTESMLLWHDHHDRRGIGESLNGLAGVAEAAGQPERVARLLGATETLYEMGSRPTRGDQGFMERYATVTRGRLKAGELAENWNEGRAMALEEVVAYAQE